MANSAEGVVLMAEEPRGWRMRGVDGVGVKKVNQILAVAARFGFKHRTDLRAVAAHPLCHIVRAIL